MMLIVAYDDLMTVSRSSMTLPGVFFFFFHVLAETHAGSTWTHVEKSWRLGWVTISVNWALVQLALTPWPYYIQASSQSEEAHPSVATPVSYVIAPHRIWQREYDRPLVIYDILLSKVHSFDPLPAPYHHTQPAFSRTVGKRTLSRQRDRDPDFDYEATKESWPNPNPGALSLACRGLVYSNHQTGTPSPVRLGGRKSHPGSDEPGTQPWAKSRRAETVD
ncbi:hypothetical protein BO99DRAFT_474809 [Aspergillus violaceofuscus CBS 115571]|uniref:Uncharacterized protein n=1 Tax=Aspergillus violaceofuscus (strain CBS 115571) TaxID=1450538 RepID=A0A2V5H1E6_ASPV1|nr:hypothetical protein BO99DRAFT_474809 [Aspergillus violaceofuscus CBS 115571]